MNDNAHANGFGGSGAHGNAERVRTEAERLSATLPPLLVEAEKLASAISLGVHGRRKAGMGESFWQFRRYQSEDPATAIDWRQSAKSQHLFVREREWEAAEAVWFWRDGSAGMRFHSDGINVTKIDRASVLTLALAALLVRGGERIALLGEGHGPATGRAALRRMAHALIELTPDDAALPPEAPITKRAQFVWVSDFLSPLSEIESALRNFAHSGQTGHLVHIIDPAEEDFPFSGRTRFEMPGGAQSEIFGRAETVQSAYRTRFKAHSETLAALAHRLGWSYLAHRTDKSPQSALIALYSALGGPMKHGA
ncbi:MAG TPA: DUF58 domain-containing protein [Rhizomicrobium sp.]|nr:DUF58 domain-containing protein [Rhizomicrobium sp.]